MPTRSTDRGGGYQRDANQPGVQTGGEGCWGGWGRGPERGRAQCPPHNTRGFFCMLENFHTKSKLLGEKSDSWHLQDRRAFVCNRFSELHRMFCLCNRNIPGRGLEQTVIIKPRSLYVFQSPEKHPFKGALGLPYFCRRRFPCVPPLQN